MIPCPDTLLNPYNVIFDAGINMGHRFAAELLRLMGFSRINSNPIGELGQSSQATLFISGESAKLHVVKRM
jgi:hypothetical protein